MRLRLFTSIALLMCSVFSGCAGRAAEPASALPGVASTTSAALASKAERPFAYVAEICASSSSCSAPNGLVEMLGGATITTDVEDPQTLALDDSGNLYVGNSTTSNAGDISVYAPKSVTPLRILSGIVGVPKGLVTDAGGDLIAIAQYRAGCCELEGTGAAYAAGATKPHHRLKGLSGFAHAPVFDQSGNLYVGNFDIFPGWVSVYGPGQYKPSRVIQSGIGLPIGLAIAPDGDLVVANGLFSGKANVVVYPPGAGAPSLTITAHVVRPTGVAVDRDGNIYVSNSGNGKSKGWVSVYRHGQTTLWRVIRSGITFPAALAFDKSGRLYVANVPNKATNTIGVYAVGGSTPIQTYSLKQQFAALAVPR